MDFTEDGLLFLIVRRPAWEIKNEIHVARVGGWWKITNPRAMTEWAHTHHPSAELFF
jgi:hypothetical protein